MSNKEKTQFKSQGVGVKSKTTPVSVMLPPQLEILIKSMPNRSEYIRKAIANQLEQDGFLSTD